MGWPLRALPTSCVASLGFRNGLLRSSSSVSTMALRYWSSGGIAATESQNDGASMTS